MKPGRHGRLQATGYRLQTTDKGGRDARSMWRKFQTCATGHNASCQVAAGFVSVTRILDGVLPMKEAGAREGRCYLTAEVAEDAEEGGMCTMCSSGHGEDDVTGDG